LIRWTAAGAVSDPTTLQIRVAARFRGRIGVGAPVPRRDLTVAEVAANITYFAVTRRGPRTPGCDALVLSGVDEAEPWVELVADARAQGIERVTLHCGADRDLATGPLAQVCDGIAMSVRGAADAAGLPSGCHAVVLLEDAEGLSDVVSALVQAKPARVTLTWPFPGGAVPPRAEALAPGVRRALDTCADAGISAGVKGLPLCTLAPGPRAGRWADRVWRSPNRWYVDASHQLDQALAFFPDVVRFSKPDSCRFCSANRRCDGVAEDWIRLGITGPLTPVPFGG